MANKAPWACLKCFTVELCVAFLISDDFYGFGEIVLSETSAPFAEEKHNLVLEVHECLVLCGFVMLVAGSPSMGVKWELFPS